VCEGLRKIATGFAPSQGFCLRQPRCRGQCQIDGVTNDRTWWLDAAPTESSSSRVCCDLEVTVT